MLGFIEVTVTSDSTDSLTAPRKAGIRADTITSFVDISSGGFAMSVKTSITLVEPFDFVNDDDETGGVVRGQRTLAVQEDYETVKRLISDALR